MSRLLLCTDLDRTLLPNGKQPESELARKRFRALTMHPQVKLAYVTGRHQELVKQAIDEYKIPQPDYVIADVGSTIYQLENSAWHQLPAWENKINKDWHGKSRDEIQLMFSPLENLQLQELSKQNTHKLSYYIALEIDPAALISNMQTLLAAKNVHANFIYSIDEAANIGLLDVLPISAGKRQAIEFLMQELGFSHQETIFAGDSGNDICVLASSIQSVLVANASEDIRSAAKQEAIKNNQLQNLYLAQGNYLDMNGNYSAGILEGVAHYLPEAENWFKEA
ncbi:MAG: HAD-IIB family hydrolase [Gammaproteobacteria bacterium]|nr:HAD-IIB family hydrolase [Gammaproteobacteria bacterium]